MYWLILLRPYSPSRLSAWSDGITPVISCMMIEALMYGFTPRAIDREAREAAAGDQVQHAEQGVALEELLELGRVDARHRHVGQEPEDDEHPEDIEDPAPDVRRPEGVQQRLEHWLRVLVVGGVCLGCRGRLGRLGVAGLCRGLVG